MSRPAPRTVAIAFAALGILGAVLAVAGVTSWPLLGIASIAVAVAVARVAGAGLGVATAAIGMLALLLGAMMLTTLVPLSMTWVLAVILLAVTVAAAIAIDRASAWHEVDRQSVALVAPAAIVSLAFPIVALLARVVPGATSIAWVMLGDSANNVLFARGIVDRGGIAVGAAENPVPLPSALIAFVMDPGRSRVAPQDLLQHDLDAFTVVWALAIGATAFIAGVLAASIARDAGAPTSVVAIASTAAAVLPLSWMFTGYPIEYGFFNTHVSAVILLGAVLAVVAGRGRPALVLSLLIVAGILSLAVWSPLVLIPIALAVVVAIAERRGLVATRGPMLWLLVGSVVAAVAYGGLIMLPSLLRNAGFLSAPGGAVAFPKAALPVIAVAVVIAAILAAGRWRSRLVAVAVAVGAASGIGMVALLVVAGWQWTYYPLKFAWLTILFLLVIGLGAVLAAAWRLAARAPRRITLGIVAVVGIASIASLAFAPVAANLPTAQNPVRSILGGNVLGDGDEVSDTILELADPEQSHFLWHSSEPAEGAINFWVLQMWSNSMSENLELKYAAYGLYDADDVNELCRIVGLMGGGTIVHTADATLPDQVAEACDDVSMEIVIDR